ncbi:kinetochore-associated Ndc80 complex subunit NDC80 TDEL_0B02260 [Torulaspora delbrueckii]|uniref:Kinetochore protein NDC80 n=1 Tax=Torulaspora delbrueckii TaxID=4950 RepID=G8ZP11_TORDE|nr:hypothetical protein TDEL_0B02260 [Torulaspora delbrueckii]CCE90355.1 hypothetical protein TDEL_0B02260 [Torulaspora delbrueckii]
MDQVRNEKGDVLDSLNPQKFTSQIPVSTIGKRRNTTNIGLTDMIQKSMEKNAAANVKRRHRSTVLSEEPSASFRLSQRFSSFPHANSSSTTTKNSLSSRDPRPLRDRNFQNAVQEEIFDYLTRNKFDLEMNHPISLKFLKLPTQKGFVLIFKWLYLRLDPGYNFTKSIEHEVYQILKNLQYPYLETINKSQISAVGGSSWPRFLGMLHWLVKINVKLDQSLQELDQNLFNDNTQELTILNHPLDTLDEQDQKQEKYELMVERLFIEYVMESYRSFLRLEDNYDSYMEQLEAGFMKFTHIIKTDIKRMGDNNDEIMVRCENKAKRSKNLALAVQKCKALKSDLTKFQNYVNTMDHKSNEWPKKLEKMRFESSAKMQQISDLEKKVKELQESLKIRGVSIELIDEKSTQRDNIANELDLVTSKVDQLVAVLKSDKFEKDGILRNMIETVRQYNTAIENLVSLRAKLGHNVDESLLKVSLSDEELQKEDKGIAYESIFSSNHNTAEKAQQELSKLYKEIQERVKNCQMENSTIEAKVVDLQREIREKTNAIERLELQLSDAKSNYELKLQENESSLLSQKIEIEKLEKKISDSSRLTKERLAEAEQLVQVTKIKHEELLLDINRKRVSLHAQVIEIIEYASNFKINIQAVLEKTEGRITEQLESL